MDGPQSVSVSLHVMSKQQRLWHSAPQGETRKLHVVIGVRPIPLHEIGTYPENRGRLGVSAFHVHEVAASIVNDGFSSNRYRDCTVVRVPTTELAEFRSFNADMAAACPLLPPCSEDKLIYAALTKCLGRC